MVTAPFRAAHALLILACLLTMVDAQETNSAPDVYFKAKLQDLKIIDGELPKLPDHFNFYHRERSTAMKPRIVLDGPGEAYAGERVGLVTGQFWSVGRIKHESNAIAFRAPAGSSVTGTIYLPKDDWSGMSAARFQIQTDAGEKMGLADFHKSRQAYYDQLRNQRGGGTAWFRHQASQSRALSGAPAARNNRFRRWDDQATFGWLTGSRAISENLQLDRMLNVGADDQVFVETTGIKGITIAEIDWKPLLVGVTSSPDPLASLIPADQHAVFLSDFGKLIQLIDEIRVNGILLDAFSSRVEEDRTLPKYERQLCLQLDAASRAFGGTLAKSVAITGSDLDLQMGTDVAVLFETPSAAVLLSIITAKQQAAIAAADSACEADNGTIGGITYFGAKSADRSISSYVATVKDSVVVTNSLAQLKHIVETADGSQPAMGELDEYKFFRHRYPLSNADETVFVMLTDAAIRRWCGPRWRIASSRRTRVAAILAEETAHSMDQLVAKSLTPTFHQPKWGVSGMDQLSASNSGYRSSTYGDARFMTPIIELDTDLVTRAEQRAYETWRDSFHRNWHRVFDPIGISLSVKKRKVALDFTVMPLILQSGYSDLIELTKNVTLAPDAGDRHPGSMLNFTIAVNPQAKSSLLQFVRGILGPFDWMGESASLVFEHDPYWQELADVLRKGGQPNLSNLPVYIRFDIDNPDGAADFEKRLVELTTKSGPDYVTLETAEYKGRKYSRLVLTEKGRGVINATEAILSLGSTDRAFIVTFNERLMKAAIDRDQAAQQALDAGKPVKSYGRPWIGNSVGTQADLRLMETLSGVFGGDYQGRMQARSWSNIPILNEWKQRYGDKDAVALHQSVWDQSVRCPGGGTYKWNPEFQTYESTVYGHPAKPRVGPGFPKQLQSVERLNFGLTFENNGLRSRVELDRQPF